jgi:hypothetical protein
VQKEFSGLVGPPAEEIRFHESDRQCCGSGIWCLFDPGSGIGNSFFWIPDLVSEAYIFQSLMKIF